MQRRLFLSLIILFLIMLFLTNSVYADEQNALNKAIEEAQKLKEYLSFDKLFKALFSNFASSFNALSRFFGLSIAAVMISGIFASFKDSLSGYETIFDIISVSLHILSCYTALIWVFDYVTKALTGLCGYMTSFIPIGCALLASSGNTASASVSAMSNSILINAVQLISISFVLPCLKAVCAVSTVNALCRRTNLSGISSFFKSLCLWATGLSFTVLTGILSLQNILSSGADNLAMKGIRYSAARLIPVAGSMISESMKTVIASMSFIKSVSGTAAVVFIIYSIILPLCAVIACKMYFLILSAAAKAACQDKSACLFDGLNSSLNILTALLLGCAVAFIISAALFIKTTVSI